MVDKILMDLRSEIAYHVSMIEDLIWAKSNTMGAPGGRQPPEDQLTRELKRELAVLKREREMEEKNLPEADYGVESVTDGAKALSLNDADVKRMAEKKTEVSESDEAKLVATKLKELRQA